MRVALVIALDVVMEGMISVEDSSTVQFW